MRKAENWSENSNEIFLKRWIEHISVSEDIPSNEAEFVIQRILEATGCTDGVYFQAEANQLLRKLEQISWSRLLLTVLNTVTVSISRCLEKFKHQAINFNDPDNINEKLGNERVTLTLLLVAKSLIFQHWRNKPLVEKRNSSWGTEKINGTLNSSFVIPNCNQPTEKQQTSHDIKNKELIKSTLLHVFSLCCNADPVTWKNNVDEFAKYVFHISELIARISRFEFPQNWSELSLTLTQFFKYQQSDTFLSVQNPSNLSHTIVLYYLVKEQSSKRLPTAVSDAESLGADFLDISWKLWCCIDNISGMEYTQQNIIYCQKIFRYIEKTMLLTACYFFRPSLVSSNTSSLPCHKRERVPMQVVQNIFLRYLNLMNMITENSTQDTMIHFAEIDNINFYILQRLASMSKLLVTFTEKQRITFAYATNEIQPVVEKLFTIIYSPQIKVLCEKNYYKVNKWISMCFRFLGLLLSNEVEASQFQEQMQLTKEDCSFQNYLLKVQQDVWKLLCFGIQFALFEVKNDLMLKWLKLADVEDFGNFYLKGNEETVNALEFFIYWLSKCSYGLAVLEPQLAQEAKIATDQFFKSILNLDKLSEDHVLILQKLNVVMLWYLFLSTSWSIYSISKSNFAQHQMMIPKCLYQHAAIELLRPASLDVFLKNNNSNAFFDLIRKSDIVLNLPPDNVVLYFAYVARCIMFISTWAELVLLQFVPNEFSSNDISVTTVIPILLLWSSVTSVPIPIRVLSIYALNMVFDAFKDHPVWWFGSSQLPMKLQDPQIHGFSSLVQASLSEKSAMSDLFLSAAIDLLSIVKSPEAVSECLTLTSKILIATIDPVSHTEDERLEGCFSSLMSVTSANEENNQCDLDDDTCRQHTPTREPKQRGLLLLSFIRSIWCNLSRISNITPIHSIVLDNLTFLIILQWRKYYQIVSQDNDEFDESYNSKLQPKAELQKTCSRLPLGALESAHITLQVFNLALDALAVTTNFYVWSPYWCKIGNVFDELLRLFLVYPTPFSLSSLISLCSVENTSSPGDSLFGYLELCSDLANTFLRLFEWITVVITKEQHNEELSLDFRLLDLQLWDTCFECVCILVQSKVLASSAFTKIEEEQLCSLKANMFEREMPFLSCYCNTENAANNASSLRTSILPAFEIDFAPKLINLVAVMITCNKLVDNYYETFNLGLRLLFHLTVVHCPTIDMFLDAVIQELLCLVLCQHNIINIVESHISMKDTVHTNKLLFSELEAKRRYILHNPDKAVVFEFISACIIHKPNIVRNVLDRLLAMVLLNIEQPQQSETEEGVKAIVFGFILLVLETACPDSFPQTKASLIIASVDNIVAQIPLMMALSSQQPLARTSPVRGFCLECCVAIIILVFRQIAELEEAFTMHKQQKQQLRLSQQPLTPPYTLPQFCSPATTRLLTTNSNRKKFRNSAVSSQYGRLAAFDQFISSPTPQGIIHKQFLPKSLRLKNNKNQCLTLPLEKRYNLDKELEDLGYSQKLQKSEQNRVASTYPKFLLYIFYVLAKWIGLIQNECASILEVVSQLLTPDESFSSKIIPSFKTLFSCFDNTKPRSSIQSIIYDELDIEAARKGLIVFENFFADYISLQLNTL